MGIEARVLYFDETYLLQPYLRQPGFHEIKLTDLKGTNAYCDLQAQAEIRKRLRASATIPLTLLGAGNYHYVSLLLLEQVTEPFTLVLFDHHTDLLGPPAPDLLSCGSWVAGALSRLPLLQQVVLIGTDPAFVKQIPPRFAGQVTVFTETPTAEQLARAIQSPTIYVSIDKDVLSEEAALTNWDQGDLKLTELLNLVEYLGAKYRVVGIDICGEYPPRGPLSLDYETRLAAKRNERANRLIVEVAQGVLAG